MSLLELIGNYLMAEFVQCTGMPDVPACSYILFYKALMLQTDRQPANFPKNLLIFTTNL